MNNSPDFSYWDSGLSVAAWVEQNGEGKVSTSVSINKNFRDNENVLQTRKMSFFKRDIPILICLLEMLYTAVIEKENAIYRKKSDHDVETPASEDTSEATVPY